MIRRTKTYIAGDWDNDIDAINQLHKWNLGDKWSLHFVDVHSLTQSYDTSLYCSIKTSLHSRMTISKTFVLVVGEHTNTVTKGACYNCTFYNRYLTLPSNCSKGNSIDNRSYIKYECELAIRNNCKIVVLYNSTIVNKSKCPEVLRNIGMHIAMKTFRFNPFRVDWDYDSVNKAI